MNSRSRAFAGFVSGFTLGWVGLASPVLAQSQGSALAQSQDSSPPNVSANVPTEVYPGVQTPAQLPPAQIFTLFGLPVRVVSPVAQPYSGSAYRNFGGQPQSGADAVLAQDTEPNQ